MLSKFKKINYLPLVNDTSTAQNNNTSTFLIKKLTNAKLNHIFQDQKAKKILPVILRVAALESAYLFTWSAVSYQFMDPLDMTWWSNPFASTTASVSLNILLRFLAERIEPTSKKYANLKDILHHFCGINFGFADLMMRDVIVHESGHAIMAPYLYANANPNIMIYWKDGYTNGGVTRLNTQFNTQLTPTPFAENIGLRNTKILLSGSGTVMSLLVDMLTLTLAQMVSHDFSHIKSHMRYMVLMDMIDNLSYSLSPYIYGCNEPNDFCSLEEQGVSPAAAAGVMLTTMLIFQFILSMLNKCCSGSNEKSKRYIINKLQD